LVLIANVYNLNDNTVMTLANSFEPGGKYSAIEKISTVNINTASRKRGTQIDTLYNWEHYGIADSAADLVVVVVGDDDDDDVQSSVRFPIV